MDDSKRKPDCLRCLSTKSPISCTVFLSDSFRRMEYLRLDLKPGPWRKIL